MLLALDIGNTETTIGLFAKETLQARWRLTTHTPRTPDELRAVIQELVQSQDLYGPAANSAHRMSPTDARSVIEAAVICSVVPGMTQAFVDACLSAFHVTPILVDSLSPLPMTLQVDQPAAVGPDRIVNTLAANQLYHRDAIVVDLGTATTFDCITADGIFLGGVIQPGILTASESLIRKTSMLPDTTLALPERVIGTNTADAIRSGVVFGAADAIDGVIRRIKGEWPTQVTPHVIATGGLATTFRHICQEVDQTDPDLTLKGLQIAYSIISG